MIEIIKRQNLQKLWFMLINVFRITCLKIRKGKHINVSFIQNLHPNTEIAVEKGTLIMSHSVFTRRNVCFRAAEGVLKIGTSFFNQGCSITAMQRIEIGDDCIFAPNVVVVDHDHDFTYLDKRRGLAFKKSDVIIGNNVWIGSNVTILRGTNIGDNSVIGAGLTIKGDIPANSLVRRNNNGYSVEAIFGRDNLKSE